MVVIPRSYDETLINEDKVLMTFMRYQRINKLLKIE